MAVGAFRMLVALVVVALDARGAVGQTATTLFGYGFVGFLIPLLIWWILEEPDEDGQRHLSLRVWRPAPQQNWRPDELDNGSHRRGRPVQK